MNRFTLIMTMAVLCGFSVLLLMNVASFLGVVPAKYISPSDVRGIAVQHDGKLYTLNFSQQNTMVDIFNRMIPVKKELVFERQVKTTRPEVQKIIIYRFNAPDIEITPIAYVMKTTSLAQPVSQGHLSMVLSVPDWNAEGFLEESTNDELHQLLPTTYDHH